MKETTKRFFTATLISLGTLILATFIANFILLQYNYSVMQEQYEDLIVKYWEDEAEIRRMKTEYEAFKADLRDEVVRIGYHVDFASVRDAYGDSDDKIRFLSPWLRETPIISEHGVITDVSEHGDIPPKNVEES